MNKRPVSYLQTDPRWKNKPSRVPGEQSTIGSAGCGPTAAAMLIETTLTLTGVFAYLAVSGQIAQDFMTIYAVIIAFYFGTQSQKAPEAGDKGSGDEDGQ